MKSFLVLCVALVVFEITTAQVIRSLAPGIIGGINNCGCSSSIFAPALPSCPSSIIAPTIPACPSSIIAPAIPAIPVQSNSVAASLADTLSLLTVSSLLAETLPMGPLVAPGCGCGCGMGYGGYYY